MDRIVQATGGRAYDVVKIAYVLEQHGVVESMEEESDKLFAWGRAEGLFIDPQKVDFPLDEGYVPVAHFPKLLARYRTTLTPSELEHLVWADMWLDYGVFGLVHELLTSDLAPRSSPNHRRVEAYLRRTFSAPPAVPPEKKSN